MLCGIISYYFDNHGENCSFNNLAHFFDVTVMNVIAYNEAVNSLLSKGYIRNTSGLDEKEIGLRNAFELSTELLHCILHNKKITVIQNLQKNDLNFSL